MKKSKITLFYLIINIVFLAMIGYFTYKIFFPDKPVYPDPVNYFEQTLKVPDQLKTVDPYVVDKDDKLYTYSIELKNTDTKEKIFYLYVKTTGDQKLVDQLTLKIKLTDTDILMKYNVNGPLRKITLAPGESKTIYAKIYLDVTQILTPAELQNLSVNVVIKDDYVSFYNIKIDESSNVDTNSEPAKS